MSESESGSNGIPRKTILRASTCIDILLVLLVVGINVIAYWMLRLR